MEHGTIKKEWEIAWLKCRREFTYEVFQVKHEFRPPQNIPNPRYTFIIEEIVFLSEYKNATMTETYKHKTDENFKSPAHTAIAARKAVQGMKQEIQDRLKELEND